MSAMRKPRRRLGWMAFGLGMIALRLVMDWVPGFAEDMYGRGIFPLIRLGLDNTLGRLPFPAVYLLVLLILLWAIRRWGRRERSTRSLLLRLESAIVTGMSVLFGAVGLFLVLWGFNYARIPLRHQLELPLDPLDGPAMVAELQLATTGLNNWAGRAPVIPAPGLETRVRQGLAAILQEVDWPAVGRPRVRFFHPGGLLKVFGVSGIYNPFTGAATIPGGLPMMTRPFTAAHEMAHAWGITDEGEANLAAFLACTRSGDPELAYSAHLAWWGYLAGPVARADRNAYVRITSTLTARVRDDMELIRVHWQRYRGSLQRIARQANDAYLRSQGVAAGVISYEAFPALVRAWRRRESKLQHVK